MALTDKTKNILKHNVMESKSAATEIIAVLDTNFNATPAAAVADITSSNLVGVDLAGSIAV